MGYEPDTERPGSRSNESSRGSRRSSVEIESWMTAPTAAEHGFSDDLFIPAPPKVPHPSANNMKVHAHLPIPVNDFEMQVANNKRGNNWEKQQLAPLP